jgi:hypothetical protein
MFKPTKSSQTLCEACEKQERAARAAARNSGVSATRISAPVAGPVRIVGPAANLIDPTATNASAINVPPPDTGLYGAAAIREEQRQAQQRREEQRQAEARAREEQRAREFAQRREEARSHDRNGHHDHGAHSHGAPRDQRDPRDLKRGPKPAAPRGERPTQAPRPPRQPRVAVPRVELNDDLRARIEARYLELAQPIEFDGIRTKIAAELSVPKSIVKRAVAELRARMQLPSWWELQAYSGAESDLERIRRAYLPHLPLPEVGIHKSLAEELTLDPRTVYQGIRRIRAEMRLPQYNAPEAHASAQPASEPTTSDASQPSAPNGQG